MPAVSASRSRLCSPLLVCLLFAVLAIQSVSAAPLPLAPADLSLTRTQPIPHWNQLRELYAGFPGPYLWHDADGNPDTPLIDSLLQALDTAVSQGLPASLYHDRQLTETQSVPTRDLLLSDALLRLVNDMGRGRDVAHLDRLWHLPRPELDTLALAITALQQRDPKQVIESLAPSALGYRQLVERYQHYRLLAAQPALPELPEMRLEPGDQAPEVPLLRSYLIRQGDAEPDPLADQTAPKLYDDQLVTAVRRFQQRQGLGVDGIVGPKTRAALMEPLAGKLAQIEANLERWRWLPRNLGDRYLLVSPAGYFLDLVEEGVVRFHARTISGRPHRPTPSFQSTLESLTVNPDWTVPRSIMRKDLIPKIVENPGWLAENNVRVERFDEGRWRSEDPMQVDWTNPGHIRLIQSPGPLNALGQMKFGMRNPFSIYLHDTPSKSLFEKPLRPFSSGCVRVEGIVALAQYLLAEDPRLSDWLSDAMSGPATSVRALSKPVPVYLVYLTAWVDPEGRLQFRPDIYGLDRPLLARLKVPEVEPYSALAVNH
ncbi:L,D-transpeptidase family protein [Marinobacterium litorale]|uniref:L,D-transpeptidase family protein n=1 Tax=Marinobacterium litorale TaxID=404770 RepID=UPI0006891211|nr:L,D-transpeptidase family protein [Marinobacterium litorale]